MLGSGPGQLERPNFQQSDRCIAANEAQFATYPLAVRKAGVEQGHSINTATAQAQIAGLRVHPAESEGLK
jgi:hypothetical protein